MKKIRDQLLVWLGTAGGALLIIAKWGAIVRIASWAYRSVAQLLS